MKKIMSLALGLSLLGGAITAAAATPDMEKEGKAKSKTKKGKKGTSTEEKAIGTNVPSPGEFQIRGRG